MSRTSKETLIRRVRRYELEVSRGFEGFSSLNGEDAATRRIRWRVLNENLVKAKAQLVRWYGVDE
jgi:hypothetical protein